MKHELKIKPEYFAAIYFGEKTFEIRNNADRNFQVGDTLMLKAWDGEFTGDFVEKVVSYITDFEQKPGYVVLGLVNRREHELLEKFHRTGVAIERAISTGSVLEDHPLKSRLDLLANHHKREQELTANLDRAERAMICSGFTYTEGAQEWKPPIGPSASPLLDRIDQLAAQLAESTRQRRIKAALDLLRDVGGFFDYVRNDVELFGPEGGQLVDLHDRIDALLTGEVPATAVTVTETIRTAPEQIWLQVGDRAHYHSEPFPRDTSEVSWCADSVVGCEVPYVRADLVGRYPAVQEGWQLVPVELTSEMLLSMKDAHWAIRGCQLCEQDYADIHTAMLAAAPNPEG